MPKGDNPKSRANLEAHKWKKGQSGNPNGRPKKYVTQLTVEGYKLSEINDTIQTLMAMTLSELKEVFNDDDATILEVTIAKALFNDASEGKLTTMETILSRVFGKPKQSFENTITEQPLFPDIEYLDIEDAKEIE